MGHYAEASSYKQEAYRIANEIGDKNLQTTTLMYLGSTYLGFGRYVQALESYEKALVLFQSTHHRKQEGICYNNLGEVNRILLGNYKQALEYYSAALNIARELHDLRAEGTRLGNLGETYIELGQHEDSLKLFEQSLNIAQKIGYLRSEAIRLNCLGTAYTEMGQFTEAIKYQNQSLEIVRNLQASNLESESLMGLGRIYLWQGQYDEALKFLTNSLSISESISNLAQQISRRILIAQLFLYKRNPDEAFKTISLARQIDIPKDNHRAQLLHGLILLFLGHSQKAALALNEAIQSADNLLLQTENMYSPKYTRAIALSALGKMSGIPDYDKLHGQEQKALDDGKRNCHQKGVVDDYQHLLSLIGDLTNV